MEQDEASPTRVQDLKLAGWIQRSRKNGDNGRTAREEHKGKKLLYINPDLRIFLALGFQDYALTRDDLTEVAKVGVNQLPGILDYFERKKVVVCLDKEERPMRYRLAKEYVAPAKTLGWALMRLRPILMLNGVKELERRESSETLQNEPVVYRDARFEQGLRDIMGLIITELPKAEKCARLRILNIEKDPCFNKPSPEEHWFYCHGISTRLQKVLPDAEVRRWVNDCNEKGIGEVVMNDRTFGMANPWKIMIPLRSHEYWILTQEIERPEGYIAFGRRLALIAWEKEPAWYTRTRKWREFSETT